MASRTPTPGCLIGVTALIVFGLLITWTVYTGYTQNKEIAKFTSPEPADLGVVYRDPETVGDLRHRVRVFGKATLEGESPSLALSVDDLNDLIGHESHELVMDLRPMIAFKEIGETVKARIAFPMQTLFQGGKFRYLNGTVTFAPRVEEGQLMLRIVDVTPDTGGEVPEGFLDFISGNLNLLAPFREDKQLGPVLKRIRSVSPRENQLVLQAE